jgi:hypothetical protein
VAEPNSMAGFEPASAGGGRRLTSGTRASAAWRGEGALRRGLASLACWAARRAERGGRQAGERSRRGAALVAGLGPRSGLQSRKEQAGGEKRSGPVAGQKWKRWSWAAAGKELEGKNRPRKIVEGGKVDSGRRNFSRAPNAAIQIRI